MYLEPLLSGGVLVLVSFLSFPVFSDILFPFLIAPFLLLGFWCKKTFNYINYCSFEGNIAM